MKRHFMPLALILGLLLSVLPAQAQAPAPSTHRVARNTAVPSAAFVQRPAYDSGWIPLSAGTARTLAHNLGGNTEDYVVRMDYRSASSGINQRYYGGVDFGGKSFGGTKENHRVGAYWRTLTPSTITVYRRPEDTYATEVRIRIWIDPHPDYDSGWVSLTAGASARTLSHGLLGDVNDYVVDMTYKTGSSGINQRYFGGADFGATSFGGTKANDRVGAYWRSLTSSTITVYRRSEDTYATQVRIRIWRRPSPTYDSGWFSLAQGSVRSLTHAIGGDNNAYVVIMDYKANNVNGINARHYGGADFFDRPAPGHSVGDRVGAYWRSLTTSRITVYRRAEDTYAPQLRIRIWSYEQRHRQYLPTMRKAG